MFLAFGATLTNSQGELQTGRVENIWERAAKLRGRVYRLPGGSPYKYWCEANIVYNSIGCASKYSV